MKEEEQQETPMSSKRQLKDRYLQATMAEFKDRPSLLEAPREISKKSYSLAPDMATGWKPRRPQRINLQNVFPLNFSNIIIDAVVKHLSKKNSKYPIVHLGPRKLNSYKLHEHRPYDNPYPMDKKTESHLSERPGIIKPLAVTDSLKFDSDFECANLDVAIQISRNQYDLFMRVDSNTKGHTNWYYFEVQNFDWVGEVQFNFLNFRRERSLYQRGMKPYVWSEKNGKTWAQGGRKVLYEKKNLRYKFLYDEDEDYVGSLGTYFTMSFTYDFSTPHDRVQFAYCIPYTYSSLLSLLRELAPTCPEFKFETGWRSLSGLPVPVIQVTDPDESPLNKKVVLVTARIHPGQSNSSHVCEGILRAICSSQSRFKELRRKYHFYIMPMLNPDGVVAGNYRTSLFGKDLNRTFNQSRKYAFPEIYHLVDYTKKLKKQHKQRFTIYLDLHGHSVKKNVFFYGPDYSITHNYYNQSRDYAKILGNLSPMFRYYSCIFKISTEKATTARATFNRIINIPFTYTMESSNGGYYDSSDHQEKTFTAGRLMEMGVIAVKGLGIWSENQKTSIVRSKLRKFVIDSEGEEDNVLPEQKSEKQLLLQKQPPGKEKMSDDELSEGKSDSEPEDEDLADSILEALQKQIEGKTNSVSPTINRSKKEQKPRPLSRINPISPEKGTRSNRSEIDWSQNLRSCGDSIRSSLASNSRRQKLPPINLQSNPAQFFSKNHSRKKRIAISEALNNLSQGEVRVGEEKKSARVSVSQMMIMDDKDCSVEEKSLLLKNISKQEISLKQRIK